MKPQQDFRNIARMGAVLQYVQLSRASIYRLLKAGEFPAPIRLGKRAIGWKIDDLDSWLNSRRMPARTSDSSDAAGVQS